MGRPKKGLITDIAVRLLEQPHPDYPEKTRAQVIAERWLKRAEDGDDFGHLLDRVEGKVATEVDLTTQIKPPMVFEVGDDGRNPDLSIPAGPEDVAEESG
jgi:hypothetical protein